MNRHLYLPITTILILISFNAPCQTGEVKQLENEQEENEVFNKRFRFSFDVGLGRRVGKLPPGLTADEAEVVNNLMDGTDIGISGGYFFTPHFGAGFMGNWWTSSTKKQGKFRIGPDSIATMNCDSRDKITFAGPTFISRLNGKKAFFNAVLGIGALQYETKTTLSNNGYSSEGRAIGKTLGTYLQASLDIMLYQSVYLGFSGHYFAGAISSFEVTDGQGNKSTLTLKGNSRESMARVGGNIGIRLILGGKAFPRKVVVED